MTATPLWSRCPGGALVAVDPFDLRLCELEAVESGTRVRDSLVLPLEPRKLTDSELRGILLRQARWELARGGQTMPEDRLESLIERNLERARSVYGDPAPPFTRIECDGEGRVWLQRFDLTDDPLGRSREWWVLERPVSGTMVPFRRLRAPVRTAV